MSSCRQQPPGLRGATATGRTAACSVQSALTDVTDELGAHAATLYVEDPGSDELSAVAIAGSPLSVFSMPERIPIPSTQAPAQAFRSATAAAATAVAGPPTALVLAPLDGATTLAVPVPGTRAVLAGLWPAPLSRADLADLQHRLADRARQLTPAGSDPIADRAGLPPAILPAAAEHPGNALSWPTRWGLPSLSASRGLSLMYQAYALPAALNTATVTADVLQIVQDRIVRPFGLDGYIALADTEGRPRALGHSARLADLAAAIGRGQAGIGPLGAPLFLSDRSSVRRVLRGAAAEGVAALAALPFPHGQLLLVCDRPRLWPGDEQALLLMMGAQLSATLERVRLSAAGSAVSSTLQRRLLPRALPEFASLTAVARYTSAQGSTETGGDWYDLLALPGGRIGLIVGDVQGHSSGSAAIMGQLRSAIRAYASDGHPPAQVLSNASAFLEHLETDVYATCAVIALDPATSRAQVALAGHPAPVQARPDGTITALTAPANLPLAVQPQAVFHDRTLTVEPGTLLMLYTNGLPGGRDDDVEKAARLLLRSAYRRGDPLHATADALITAAAPAADDDAALLLALYEGLPTGQSSKADQLSLARGDMRAVRQVRRFVRAFLEARGRLEVSDALELIASEVATNALIHADSEVDVRIREYPDRIHFEVRDSQVAPPVPTHVTDDDHRNARAEHGRGLAIVEALATSWGIAVNGRGKAVWVDLALAPPAADGVPTGPEGARVGPADVLEGETEDARSYSAAATAFSRGKPAATIQRGGSPP